MKNYTSITPNELKSMFIEQLKQTQQFKNRVLTPNMISIQADIDENHEIVDFRVGIEVGNRPPTVQRILNRN